MRMLLDARSMENANRRNVEAGVKLHVSQIAPGLIAVGCHNGEHPQGHVCAYEWHGGLPDVMIGECFVRDDGREWAEREECPSAQGKRVCHHLSAGAALFAALDLGRHVGRVLPSEVRLLPGARMTPALRKLSADARRALGMKPLVYIDHADAERPVA